MGWVLLTVAALAASAAPNYDAKIDSGLLAQFTGDEEVTAPFFVVLAERADVKPAYRISNRAERGRYVVQALQTVANRSQAGVRGYLRGQGVAFTPFWVENKIYIAQGTLELARALAQRPEVAAIVPEAIYTLAPPQVSDGAAVQGIEWNISKIRANEVWPTTKGTGLVVANIDTGVQYTHPALAGKYRGNNGGSYTHPGNWSDPTGVCGAAPCDNNGHGSHTMGTMVGDDGAGNQIGVAPDAKWIACKGCATNSCSGSHLTACAQWMMDPKGNGGLDQPDVVNNSWGGGGGNSWYQSYVQNWRAAGIFPAFSAGNSGSNCNTTGSPGDYPESYASGATDSADGIASFSSRGPSAFGGILKPDVSAPGVSVRSSVPTNSYSSYSGTSMASPHTAGAVALLWAAAAAYRSNIAGTETLFEQNAVKLVSSTQTCGGIATGVSPNNVYGHGRLDVKKAVDASGVPPNQPPTVAISAPSNGALVDCGVPVNFTASANDPETGALTSIGWTDNAAGFGTGESVSKTFDCAATGAHTIVASVTDPAGLSETDTIGITVVNPSIPAAPSNLAGLVSARTINLTWTDNAANETGFVVERKLKSASTWAVVKTINVPDTQSTNDTVPSAGHYQYRVRAANGAMLSAPSNVITKRFR
jgi:subtilisin family serine protease